MDYVGYSRSHITVIRALVSGLGLNTPHQAILSPSTGLLEDEDHICLCELKANDATHRSTVMATLTLPSRL